MNSLVFLLASLVLFVRAEVEVEDGVLVLTEDNFDGAIASHQFILVEFYAPWCGHCKSLAPQYASAAEQLAADGSEIKLAKVDATENAALASRFGVKGYPTLKWFRNGKDVEYNGGRQSQEIVDWVNKKSGPASTLLSTSEDLTAFIAKKGTKCVAFIQEDDLSGWEAVATNAQLETFLFAHVTDVSIFGDRAKGTVELHKDGEEVQTHSGAFESTSVVQFLIEEGFPLLDELSQESWTRAMDSKKSLLAVFLSEGDEKVTGLASSIAKIYKGKYVVTSSSQLGIAERWGASGKVVPTAVFVDNAAGQPKLTIWNEETEGEMTVESLSAFVVAAASGAYKAFEKSEPIPESNDGPVVVVVGKNFDDVVRQKKDVLVEFYAPWCGHCKKLAPVYEELGSSYANDDGVVIAKMDATANNVPKDFDVRGFPTIFFVDANNLATPYDGDRDLEGFKSFIASNRVSTAAAGSDRDEL